MNTEGWFPLGLTELAVGSFLNWKAQVSESTFYWPFSLLCIILPHVSTSSPCPSYINCTPEPESQSLLGANDGYCKEPIGSHPCVGIRHTSTPESSSDNKQHRGMWVPPSQPQHSKKMAIIDTKQTPKKRMRASKLSLTMNQQHEALGFRTNPGVLLPRPVFPIKF